MATPLDRAPAPDLGTDLIPKERYTSTGFARLEWERMWMRTWQLAGFECDLVKPGDYFSYEIGPESILVVRQPDGSIAAFYNVCSHRGNRLREPGSGWAPSFTCRYHGWRFKLDGTLDEALDAETFPQGCPAEKLAIPRVCCDSWGGFIWINLDPDTLDVNDDVNVPIDCYDRHTRMILKLAMASPRHLEHGQVTERIREHFLRTAGIDPDRFEGTADDVRPTIAKAVREIQGPAMGADFSELDDSQLVDDFHYTVFPNLTFNIFGRSAWLFRHRPDPDDPNKMRFDFFNLLRAPSAGIARAKHQDHVLDDDLVIEPVGGGGELMAQDFYNLPRIQAGMNSRGFSGLHLGSQEVRIRHFHRTLDDYLASNDATDG